jgi:hypothetical protein
MSTNVDAPGWRQLNAIDEVACHRSPSASSRTSIVMS